MLGNNIISNILKYIFNLVAIIGSKENKKYTTHPRKYILNIY